jgi:hypothetical protein
MRLKGKSIPLPKPVTVTFHRGDEVFTLVVKAVLDGEGFDKILSEPVPPVITKVGGSTSPDLRDKKYLQAKKDWELKRTTWFLLEALSATPDLEWETVDINDPDTYPNLEKELETFTPQERARLFEAINEAQNPTGKTEEQALENFIQRLLQPVSPQSSETVEPTNTESGEAVSG